MTVIELTSYVWVKNGNICLNHAIAGSIFGKLVNSVPTLSEAVTS